ncbi:hypothetical protein, partial [Salmonella enterica]|uniref:hypothetical protein n=1 Tax=Salmonella enterica TaxID=28901 RepID=UPI0020C4586E
TLIHDTPATTTTVEEAPPVDSTTTVEQTASNNDEPADDVLNEVPPPADCDPNAFFNPFANDTAAPDVAESSTNHLNPENLHNVYQ